jgi:hypothetical protein
LSGFKNTTTGIFDPSKNHGKMPRGANQEANGLTQSPKSFEISIIKKMRTRTTKTTASKKKPKIDVLKLLRFARQKIHVKPPGLEDVKTTEWARDVSQVLPEFNHWDGQSKANREHEESC